MLGDSAVPSGLDVCLRTVLGVETPGDCRSSLRDLGYQGERGTHPGEALKAGCSFCPDRTLRLMLVT